MNYSNYVPPPEHVKWTRDMFARFKTDIAIWGIPMNHSIYRINRLEKLVELIHGPEMGPHGNCFEQLKVVCADPSIGYRVVKNIQPITPEIEAQAFPGGISGTGKTNVKIDLNLDPQEISFKRLMANYAQRALRNPKYRCNACQGVFKARVAHGCASTPGTWESEWTEIYD